MTHGSHIQPDRARTARVRLGALLMEMIAAMALFGVVLTIAVPVATRVAAIREQAQCRQLAEIELGNIMERLAARQRAGGGVAEEARSITLDPSTAAVLEQPQLAIDVVGWDDVPNGVQVTARLTWLNDTGVRVTPADLHAFLIDRPSQEVQP